MPRVAFFNEAKRIGFELCVSVGLSGQCWAGLCCVCVQAEDLQLRMNLVDRFLSSLACTPTAPQFANAGVVGTPSAGVDALPSAEVVVARVAVVDDLQIAEEDGLPSAAVVVAPDVDGLPIDKETYSFVVCKRVVSELCLIPKLFHSSRAPQGGSAAAPTNICCSCFLLHF